MTLDHLLQFREWIQDEDESGARLWPVVREQVRIALGGVDAMRAAEGHILARELSRRIQTAARLVRKLERRAGSRSRMSSKGKR